MDEESPLDAPEGNWWNRPVNRRETVWLGIAGAWGVTMFGWMLGWMNFGGQNQTGPTRDVTPEAFRKKVSAYKKQAGRATVDGEEVLVPSGTDVYIGAFQWAWDGLPMAIEAGTTYTFHLSSYDVQHGFSVRRRSNLSQQVSLQVLPDYEWLNEMTFDEPGTFEVQCNEYCGSGHASMHGTFYVVDSLDDLDVSQTGSRSGGSGRTGGSNIDEWLSDVDNYDGQVVDATDEDAVTVTVGAKGNGGPYAFAPPAVRVSPGTTVEFSWVSNNHTVTVQSQPDGANWSGHEGIEQEDFSYDHTFQTSGVYEYYCTPHESLGMKGVIEVK
ncbi:MAG: halocyanin domain-containing protein [Haloplanus sp.]